MVNSIDNIINGNLQRFAPNLDKPCISSGGLHWKVRYAELD